MRLKLSQRFNLYIGGLLLLGIFALFLYEIRSNGIFLREIGKGEASRLCSAVFDQLYTSMRLGGGRPENRAVVERFKKMDGIEDLRLIHGHPLDRQFGIESDELPIDALDRKALEGTASSSIEKTPEGYLTARFVMPLVIKEECVRCHNARPGEVSGAVSVKISLERYGNIVSGHTRDFLFWGGIILLSTSLAILLTVHKRFLDPLTKLREGSEALAGGELSYRLGLKTGDELESVGEAFDKMAESLHCASKKLTELNEKYSKLVNMAADAILLRDLETKKYVEANPAALDLSGYSRDEFLMMGPDDIYPADKMAEYREAFKRWTHDGRGYLQEAVVLKKDGFRVPVEIAGSVLELNGRKYIQEIWRDISERKGFEDTIKRHVAELEETVARRTAELNASLKELEEAYGKLKSSEQRLIQSAKFVSLGEMGAGIAHELNSPLAGILSITEVIAGRLKKDDPNYFLLGKIKDAVVRSKYIILDMLTYSRPSREGFAPMFLNETIRATLTIFISEIKTKSIDIIEDFDPGLPKILGNKGQLMEVVLNIFKNARDAMEGSGSIFITTRKAVVNGVDFAMAEFRDTGPGVPEDIMDKVFDPFFTTKEKGGGLNIGLGLSISQSIIKEHGGWIEVDSGARQGAGQGAVFRIYLPVHKDG